MNSPTATGEPDRGKAGTPSFSPPARVYRTLVADDEPPARERLKALLAAHRDFAVAGECRNGREMLEAVRTLKPDLVLLDVQMPELDGFAAWRHLAGSRAALPLVIFVTAHMQFAIHGFEVQALDYLLKPVSPHRLASALDRVRAAYTLPADGAMPVASQADDFRSSVAPNYPERIVLKKDGEFHFVKVGEILWVGAEGDFVKVYTDAGAHLVRQSLASLVMTLDPRKFLRIHRSHLVARERIRKVFVLQRSDYAVVLTDGTELRVSRPYYTAVKQLVEEHKG